MAIIKLTSEDFEKMQKFNPKSFNNDGQLYFYNGVLLKILKPDLRRKRKEIIYCLKEKQIDGKVDILDYVYFDGEFIGYTMPFLKNHSLLRNWLTNNNIDFNERKIVAKKVVEIFETMLGDDLLYFDINLDNIMMLNEPIYVDVDSIVVLNYSDQILELLQATAIKKLLLVVFSILLGKDIETKYFLLDSINKEIIHKVLPEIIKNNKCKQIINMCLKEQLTDPVFMDYIDDINEKRVKTMQKKYFN